MDNSRLHFAQFFLAIFRSKMAIFRALRHLIDIQFLNDNCIPLTWKLHKRGSSEVNFDHSRSFFGPFLVEK